MIVLLLATLTACSTATQAESPVVPGACVEALQHADAIKVNMAEFLTLTSQHNDVMSAYFAGLAGPDDVADAYDRYATGTDAITPEVKREVDAYARTSGECRKLASK